MSNLTPDGGLSRNVEGAIRSFLSEKQVFISKEEHGMLQKWAADCADPENGALLQNLLRAVPRNI